MWNALILPPNYRIFAYKTINNIFPHFRSLFVWQATKEEVIWSKPAKYTDYVHYYVSTNSLYDSVSQSSSLAFGDKMTVHVVLFVKEYPMFLNFLNFEDIIYLRKQLW